MVGYRRREHARIFSFSSGHGTKHRVRVRVRVHEYMDTWENEQQGGVLPHRRGHYHFRRVQFRECNARRYGIRRTSYHLRVENPEDTFPQGHRNIVCAFEQGLADVIKDLTETIPDHDRIQIYLSSNQLQSAHISANVTVGDWQDPLSGARRILDQISKMLNSNENFEVDNSLQLDVTHITMPEPASSKQKWRFGTDFRKNKRSIIQIKNKDHLCRARALVAAKAHVDNHPDFENIKRGCSIQRIRAQALQEEAHVLADQPTPLQAILLFQIVLSDYQIVIVSAEHGHGIVHKGPESDKQLILLSHDSHFDVITLPPAFFSKVYYCLKCEKGFDHDSITEHRCVGVKCWCCHQTDCPDFELFKKEGPATVDCTHCNRRFFGVTCQVHHMTKTSSGQDANHNQRNSVCCSYRICSICHFSYNLEKIKEHRCSEQECPCCHKVCNLQQHKCFIQPIKKKKNKRREENKTKKMKKSKTKTSTWTRKTKVPCLFTSI